MYLKNILSEIFSSKEDLSDEEDDPDQINKYIKLFHSEIIKLEGGFVLETYAIKHYNRFKELLFNPACSSRICKNIVILTEDQEFYTRDNARIQLQLPPSKHILELTVDKKVVGIDGYLLTNNSDINKLGQLLPKLK